MNGPARWKRPWQLGATTGHPFGEDKAPARRLAGAWSFIDYQGVWDGKSAGLHDEEMGSLDWTTRQPIGGNPIYFG